MPTCQNCDRKWSWKQTFRKSFTLDSGMTCPYCQKRQYLTKGTRIKTALITFITITILTICSLVYGPSFTFLYIWICLIPLFVVLYPFWVELANKEKSFDL